MPLPIFRFQEGVIIMLHCYYISLVESQLHQRDRMLERTTLHGLCILLTGAALESAYWVQKGVVTFIGQLAYCGLEDYY